MGAAVVVLGQLQQSSVDSSDPVTPVAVVSASRFFLPALVTDVPSTVVPVPVISAAVVPVSVVSEAIVPVCVVSATVVPVVSVAVVPVPVVPAAFVPVPVVPVPAVPVPVVPVPVVPNVPVVESPDVARSATSLVDPLALEKLHGLSDNAKQI